MLEGCWEFAGRKMEHPFITISLAERTIPRLRVVGEYGILCIKMNTIGIFSNINARTQAMMTTTTTTMTTPISIWVWSVFGLGGMP